MMESLPALVHHDIDRERNPLTVEQLHAVLSRAMAEGLGHRPVEIDLAYGICGMPAAVLSSAVIDWGQWGMGSRDATCA